MLTSASTEARRDGDIELPPLPRAFFSRPTDVVARELLGTWLCRQTGDGLSCGRVVETESYGGPEDLASHARAGRTRRTTPMFGEVGHAYVYLVYGMHYCLNVVTEPEGYPAAVLIRALDPVEGIDVMRRRRARAMKGRRALPNAKALPQHEVCRGPGNLTMAMGITLVENQLDLLGDRLYVEDRGIQVDQIAWGPRIGIRVGTEAPWRAWVADNPAVSARPRGKG